MGQICKEVLFKLKQNAFFLILALVVGAAIILTVREPAAQRKNVPPHFVTTSGTRFVVDGQPFRFTGANVAIMYRDEDRERMPETLAEAARLGLGVVRVWAYGEGAEGNAVMSVGGDRTDWPRTHPFRRAPDDWNEEAFVHLDRVLAEAARHKLRVQLCLTNWWRDTGGVTQYLRWAGINDAADEAHPFGINIERALAFYTNEETRRLYRQHVERIVSRRNTLTGKLYRDDPTIMAYELMNEAQGLPGRWEERRAWVAEMSAYVKSLDPNHMVTPGTWGYRSAFERRAWLAEHRLPTIDFADVHNYPRDDLDTFVDSPQALGEFVTNRAAASFSLNKPYVMGEFGMVPEGYKNFSQVEWYRAYFAHSAQNGAAGAIFWILTPDPHRGYGVTYTGTRDDALRAEIARSSALFAAGRDGTPRADLLDAGSHLVPRQFAFTRPPDDARARPVVKNLDGGGLLYRFSPEQAMRGRFEKMDGGEGYVWGAGMGFFEYVVPGREDRRRVGEIVVRAHVQPVLPAEANGRFKHTRVTLFIDGTNCGSRLVPEEKPPQAIIQEWRVTSLIPRTQAARGRPLSIRFVVELDADQPFGINLSNFPAGYDARETKPIEVEVR